MIWAPDSQKPTPGLLPDIHLLPRSLSCFPSPIQAFVASIVVFCEGPSGNSTATGSTGSGASCSLGMHLIIFRRCYSHDWLMMFQVELVCQSSTTPIAGNCAMFSLKTDWVLKLPFPLNHCLTLWNSPTFLSAPALKLGEASKCRGFSKAAAAASSAWMPRCATTILEFPKRQTVKSRKATGFKPLASNITVNPRSTVWNQCFHSSCYIQIIIYICICMYIYIIIKSTALWGACTESQRPVAHLGKIDDWIYCTWVFPWDHFPFPGREGDRICWKCP